MIDHLSTYATGFEATKAFYAAVFAPLGYTVQSEVVAVWNVDFPTQRMVGFGKEGKASFWVIEVQTAYTPRHIAFAASSRALVDAFYTQAIQSGGEGNGKPGLRPHYHPDYYGAFVLDPDGNNVEAVCHSPE